jgi:hypothetical protein
MRRLGQLIGVLLLVPAAAGMAQEFNCDFCMDGPEMFPDVPVLRDPGQGRTLTLVSRDPDAVHISPLRIAELIRQSGGTLIEMTHDCGAAAAATYGGLDWVVSACRWGGRYPALVVRGSDAAAPGPVVVLASTGEEFELLAEGNTPDAAIDDLRALSKSELDELLSELASSSL